MFIKNLLFTFIIVTGFFVTAELVLALAGVRPLLLSEDPLVGFADNVPQFVKATRNDGADMFITSKNKLSLFNFQEFPQQKGDKAYRIFCIGGSTTFGRPYQDPLSFCGWLRAYLQAADPSREWEVINAGGISYASYRVARMMNELRDYAPDLFIVYSGQNEFLEQRSYGALQQLPAWVINLDASLSGTRIYSAMKLAMDTVRSNTGDIALKRDELDGEVDDILNHTLGPKSYHRDEALRQQIIMHYRLNLLRMAKIADSIDAGIVFVKPAINIRGMSPFKSEHRNDLELDALMQWQGLYSDARELQRTGKLDEAMAKYRQALAIDDRYAELHFRIGQILFQQLRFDQAEVAFRRAVEEDIAPLRTLASMQQTVEEVAAAADAPLVDFPAIIRQAYLNEYGHTIFGSEYFTDHVHTNFEGYRKLGMALFDHLVEQGIARPEASWNAARVEAVRQEVLASIDSKDEGVTLLNLGAVFEWAGKFEEAHSLLFRALDILGPDEEIYMRLASSSYSLGKLEDAFDYLKAIQSQSPELPGLNSKLAMIRLEQGKTDEAIAYCGTELALDPGNHFPHVCMANALALLGESEKAQAYFDSALQLGPGSEFVRLSYANFLIEQNRYDEALPHSREVLRINPAQYEAHNATGSIMIRQGDLEQARHHITEALRLAPDYEAARENLQQLQASFDGVDENPMCTRDMQAC
jgi:tetratricopeptide (TPR) repeat protein